MCKIKKHWMIDIGLIFIIIVMGVFVVLELKRTFVFMRQQAVGSTHQPTALIPETEMATPEPDVLVEKPALLEDMPFELIELNGESVAFSEFVGRPILVNFWATWCPPCLEEMPLIQAYADRFGEELVVLAINAGEDEADVRAFVEQNQLELIVMLDPSGKAGQYFKVYGLPTTLFFDQKGDLVTTHIGVLNAALIDRYLSEIGLGE